MLSKISFGLKVLREDGIVPFAKKSAMFALRKTPAGNQYLYNKSKSEVKDRIEYEDSLEDILDTVLEIKPGYYPYQVAALQLRDEVRELTKILEEENAKTVLEIGTAKGGTFYIWSRYINSVEKLISVDLPGGKFGGGYNKKKQHLFQNFSSSKQMHFIRDDSHSKSTYQTVSKIADDGVDFLFLDGDHTYNGVKQDFEMYSDLLSDNGIIALHDIAAHPDDKEEVNYRRKNIDSLNERHLRWGEAHPDCQVNRFWAEISKDYDTFEIISHSKQTWGGIGVVRL